MGSLEPLEGRRLFTALVHQELHRPPTAIADVNRDGLADVVVVTEQARRGGAGAAIGFDVYLGDGKGGLRLSAHTDCDDGDADSVVSAIAVGDLTGDGVPDVALKLFSVTGQPAPVGRSKTTEAKVVLFVGGDPDSDNDGKDDTEFTRRDTFVIPHVLDTDGSKRTWVMPHVLETSGLAIGDVNGDRQADLVSWLGDNVVTVPSEGKGVFGKPVSEDAGFAATSTRGDFHIAGLGDLNGDGRADLIAYDQDAPIVIVRGWDPKTKQAVLGTVDASPATGKGKVDELLIGDLDGDGRADDLVVVSGDRYTVGRNDTQPGSEPLYSFSWGVHNGPFSARLVNVAVGNVTGDKVDDVFTLNFKGHRYIGTVTIVK